MTALLKKYKQIMDNYRSGKYGEGLHYDEIFEKAGEPDLFEKLNADELKYLYETNEISNMLYSCALKDLEMQEMENCAATDIHCITTDTTKYYNVNQGFCRNTYGHKLKAV